MSSSYINQIDAAIGAVQPEAGQNITVTPNPTGGLVVALPNSIVIPGTVTANQLAVITTGSTGLTFSNPTVATSGTPVINPPKITFGGSLWNGVALVANPSTWSITPNSGTLNFTFSSATPLGGNAVVNIADRLQAGSIIAGQSQFNFQTGSAGSVFPASSVANSVGGLATYQVTIAPGGQVTLGQNVTITGFTNLSNNGTFVVNGSSTTTLIVYNSAAVAETHAATVTTQGTYFSQAGYDVVFSPTDTFNILGTSHGIIAGFEGLPSQVNIALNSKGNSTDAAYMRIVNDGVSGDHGLEIGAIVDGTGAAPVIFQLGDFGDPAPTANLLNPVAATGITLGAPAPQLQFTGSVWNGTVSIGDTWTIQHVPSWNISQGATSELLFKHLTPGAVTSVALDGSVQSVFGQSTSWAIGPTSVTSLITPTGLIGFVVSNVSAASNAVNGLTTYTWSISPSTATNITAGMFFTISGFVNAGNNGRFQVQSTPTATSLVVYNAGGVTETHAATATIDNPFASGGVWLLEGDIGLGHYPIGATLPGINQNIMAAPNVVALAINTIGDNKDSAYFRVVNNAATTGDHGLEIGAVTDGVGTNPVTIQMGSFSNGARIQVENQPLSGLSYSITAASATFGSHLPNFHGYTTYTGTFSAPLTNMPVGGVSEEVLVTLTGFTNLANNGSFKVAGGFATPIGAVSIQSNELTVYVNVPVQFTHGSTYIFSGTQESFLNGQTAVDDGGGDLATFFTAPFTHANFNVPASITNVDLTSDVLTITATNSFTAGQTVFLTQLTSATFLNGQTVIVLSTGLSTSQFEANFTAADYPSAPDTGFALLSDTGIASIVGCTATKLTVVNGNGIAETHAATATVSNTVTTGNVFIRGEGSGSYVIQGVNSPALLNVCANPTSTNLVLTEEGNAVDSANFNIFSDPNGNHGFEIASVYGNNSNTPSFLEMAFEGGPFITLILPDENTGLTFASDSFGAPVVPTNNTVSMTTFSGFGFGANDSGVVNTTGNPGTVNLTTASPGFINFGNTNEIVMSFPGSGRGRFSEYDGYTTVAAGVPHQVARIQGNISHALVSSLLYTAPATSFGSGEVYRVLYEVVVAQAATVSSVLGGATGVQITYTQANTNVVITTPAWWGGGNNGAAPTSASVNTTQGYLSGEFIMNVAASTNISVSIGYTSSGATAMAYVYTVRLERLGNA